MRIIVFLFFPFLSFGQITDADVSDSIHVALVALIADTSIINVSEKIIEPLETFRDSNGVVYLDVGQISGGQFKAVSQSADPNVFRFDDDSLIKAWHIYEIDNWLSGYTGTNYEGYEFTGSGTITCTLTISGDTWTGIAANNTDAFGLAFYHFLIDIDFATYIQ
jgi:hypothetical protein